MLMSKDMFANHVVQIDMSNAMRTASMLPSSDKTALLEASRNPKSLAAVS